MCRAWFPYWRRLEGLDISYLDCPQVCQRSEPKYDVYRTNLCKECPRFENKQEFFRETERHLEEWLGEEQADSINLERLYELLSQVVIAENLPPERIQAKLQRWIEILKGERDRHHQKERIIANAALAAQSAK